MRIISINIAQPELIPGAEAAGPSGIFKRPQSGAVGVTEAGLIGDSICHTKDHGGRDQAVYAYGSVDYAAWQQTLGRNLDPGTFGENLTVAGMSSDLKVGDRLTVGNVLLEATAPRIPCANFAARMEDRGFAKAFRNAARPGVYFRVLQSGAISPGDSATLESQPDDAVSILELFAAYYDANPSEAGLTRLLAAPIAQRMRDRFSKQLAALG